MLKIWIILNTRVSSSKPAISIEINDVDSNNLAGYKERTRVFYMIQKFLTLGKFSHTLSYSKLGSYEVRGYVSCNQLNYYYLHR